LTECTPCTNIKPLERIATALEVLVVVEVFEGLNSARANMPRCVETLKEVRDFFREARDA